MATDSNYFLSRAEEEEERAAKAADPYAQEAHLRLALHYRASAAKPGPRPLADRPLKFTTLTIR
jgi:hypothetical protein